jgi:phage replication O-like protein O
MNEMPLIPNFTQVPNLLFDELLSELSPSELKVLLYIFRRTYGFQKNGDKIATSQICHGIKNDGHYLDKGTGLSNRAVIDALRALEKRKLITTISETTITKYIQLNISYENSSQVPLMKKVHKTYEDSSQALMKIVHRQNKEEKKNNIGSDAAEEKIPEKEVAFNSSEYIQKMKEDKQAHIRLIGSYFLKRNLSFETKKAAETTIRRHLKAAVQVVEFGQEKVAEAFEKCREHENRGIAWTLDTVLKELTK